MSYNILEKSIYDVDYWTFYNNVNVVNENVIQSVVNDCVVEEIAPIYTEYKCDINNYI